MIKIKDIAKIFRIKRNLIICIGYMCLNLILALIYITLNSKVFLIITTLLLSLFLITYILYRNQHKKIKFNIPYLLSAILISLSVVVPYFDKVRPSLILAIIQIIGFIPTAYFLSLIIGDVLLKIKIKKHYNKLKWWDIPVFMIIPLLIGGFSLLGVYPGATEYDSVYTWSMAMRTTFTDAHPILYMILMRSLGILWNEIAVVTVFQIVLVSFTYAYCAYRLKEIGLSTKLCYLFILIVTLLPSNLLTNINIVKDIPYTMGCILISVEVVRMLTNNKYFDVIGNYILLFIFTMLVLSFRHNGIFIIVVTVASLALYLRRSPLKVHLSKIIILMLLSIVIFSGLRTYAIDNVRRFIEDENNSLGEYTILTQGLATVYAEHYEEMDMIEKGIITKYLNEDFLNNYISNNDYNAYWRFHGHYQFALDYKKVKSNRIDFLKTYVHYLFKYPQDIIMSQLRITAITWSIPEYGYTNYPKLGWYDSDNSELTIFPQEIKFQLSRNWLELWHLSTESELGKVIFWRPALILCLMLILIGSKKSKLLLLALIPAIANHSGYFLILQSQDHRYFYLSYTIFILVALLNFLDVKCFFYNKVSLSCNVEIDYDEYSKLSKKAKNENTSREDIVREYIIKEYVKSSIEKE